MYVIGTAGHVDHGKSSLVQALTGINPDRLEVEQIRGLTIELGFAWMTLPSGEEISIVDVPGHVRFMRHMLAGIGAIDLAMLVIAADEGIMPQTIEHLEILDLLEINNAVIVLTKCDLVDTEWLQLIEEEINQELENTSIENSPILKVSSLTNEGMDELISTIDEKLKDTPSPVNINRPRLGIDRVFTIDGFGTVVTGTLLEGPVRIGDMLEAVPSRAIGRVRGIQSHQQNVETAYPGTRVAINLTGISTSELSRGLVLGNTGQLPRVKTFDIQLRSLTRRRIAHNLKVTVHTGAVEVQGTIRVLNGASIEANSVGWAQILLKNEISCLPNDIAIIRISDETIGGGRIVNINPPRYRRNNHEIMLKLEKLAAYTPENQIFKMIENRQIIEHDELILMTGNSNDGSQKAITQLLVDKRIIKCESDKKNFYITSDNQLSIQRKIEALLEQYQKDYPLRMTMPREEIRNHVGLEQSPFSALIDTLHSSIEQHGTGLKKQIWEPQLSEENKKEFDLLKEQLKIHGIHIIKIDINHELLGYLSTIGEVINCGNGLILSASQFSEVIEKITSYCKINSSITLADARDHLRTNRRIAQSLLEELDRRKITKRNGDVRTLI
ncbi:MAG: selenocysteine-specific translation elongation factor [Chloroflexi bacterium]|nr:selenocysteine-specific translation elongation factor [Chloroflexota bacterium]|tara:strand:+ start:3931 stop:5769 length:1839 start_codon:yes stop_codon:yes gene_type:complete